MVDAGSSSRRAWQGKAHFKIGTLIFQNFITRKPRNIYHKLFFAISRLKSKIFLKMLLSMVIHPDGRGRATPVFGFFCGMNVEYFYIIPFLSSRQ